LQHRTDHLQCINDPPSSTQSFDQAIVRDYVQVNPNTPHPFGKLKRLVDAASHDKHVHCHVAYRYVGRTPILLHELEHAHGGTELPHAAVGEHEVCELLRPPPHTPADHEAHDAARRVVEPGAAEERQHFVEHLRGVAVLPLAVGPAEELERRAGVPLRLRAQHRADLRRGEHAEEVPELRLPLRVPRVPELEQTAGVPHEAAARLLREVIFEGSLICGASRRDLPGSRRGCCVGAGAAGLEEEGEEPSAREQWVLG